MDDSYQSLKASYDKPSESNRKLVDAHLALTQALGASISGASTSVSQGSADVKAASPQLSILSIGAHQQPSSPDSVTDRLQRCWSTVHELGRTISCAINVWHGHEKSDNSDIHGSYAKATAILNQLSTGLQCMRCPGSVSWSDFDPVKSASGGCGTCQCTVVRPF